MEDQAILEEGREKKSFKDLEKDYNQVRRLYLTWRHTGGNSGGRKLALALGGHGCYLDGIGGEGGQPGHFVLLGRVGQIMGHPCVGPVELLPGDAIAWRTREIDSEEGLLAERSRRNMLSSDR